MLRLHSIPIIKEIEKESLPELEKEYNAKYSASGFLFHSEQEKMWDASIKILKYTGWYSRHWFGCAEIFQLPETHQRKNKPLHELKRNHWVEQNTIA